MNRAVRKNQIPAAASPANSRLGDEARRQLSVPFDIVVIAASAGGLSALTETLAPLPADFPAAILVAQHMGERDESMLAPLLARRTALPVRQARGGERIAPGQVYVGPPKRHLLADGAGEIYLSEAGRVDFVRPSADLLFNSAALGFRERVLALVLTGAGRDGAAGVRMIKDTGGTIIVQDPATAAIPHMPRAAIRTGCADFVLPLNRIAAALTTLVALPGAAAWFGVPARTPATEVLNPAGLG